MLSLEIRCRFLCFYTVSLLTVLSQRWWLHLLWTDRYILRGNSLFASRTVTLWPFPSVIFRWQLLLNLELFIELSYHFADSNKVGLRLPGRLADGPSNPLDEVLIFPVFGLSLVEYFFDGVHFIIRVLIFSHEMLLDNFYMKRASWLHRDL